MGKPLIPEWSSFFRHVRGKRNYDMVHVLDPEWLGCKLIIGIMCSRLLNLLTWLTDEMGKVEDLVDLKVCFCPGKPVLSHGSYMICGMLSFNLKHFLVF